MYHIGDNSRVCGEGVLGEVRLGFEFLPAVEALVSEYPDWVALGDLGMSIEEEFVEENQFVLIESLLDTGVLEARTG